MINHLSGKLQLGDWTVCSLNDGYLDLDQRMFVDIEPAAIRQQLLDSGVNCISDYIVRTQVHGYLVNTGAQLILVDTGCGAQGRLGTSCLIDNMRNLGYDPSQISLVLITHCDFDHIGGLLTADGNLVFPQASIYVPAIEANYWFSSYEESRASKDRLSCFALARKILGPYESKGKLRLIKSGETVIPGITAIDAFGHTPGHTAFLFSSKNENLLLWGDLVHSAGIQFEHLEWRISSDSDGGQAVESRKRLFGKAADEHLLVGGAHLPYSGLGYVSRQGEVFAWQPLESYRQ